MAAPIELELRTEVMASVAAVWAVASTMAGVNAELGPLLKMTHPPSMASLAGHEVVAGEVAFRSWLLLLGVVPIDRHSLGLERVYEGDGEGGGYGFDEESTSWLQRRWRHERRITGDDGAATVTDRLVVVPRVGLVTPIVRVAVGAVFRRRHRRLVARFGGA